MSPAGEGAAATDVGLTGAGGRVGRTTTGTGAGAGGVTTGTDGARSGMATPGVAVPLAGETCESAADTAPWAAGGTTTPSWLSPPELGPAASAPAGAISANVRSAVASAPDKPQNFPVR